jgi:hypothetical protein
MRFSPRTTTFGGHVLRKTVTIIFELYLSGFSPSWIVPALVDAVVGRCANQKKNFSSLWIVGVHFL